MTSSRPLARWLAKRVKAERQCYRRLLKRCQRDFSESAVHDLRIQTRRLLALLDLLGALKFSGPLEKTHKLFKKRLDAFDDVRDTHVQLCLLKPLRRRFAAAVALEKWLCRHECCLIARLRQGVLATKSSRGERLLRKTEKRLRCALNLQSINQARPAVAAVLRDAYARAVACRSRIRREQPPTVHRTRIAFKRFRYMLELLQPWLGGPTQSQLRRMRQYQARMGQVQDLQVLLAGIRRATADGALTARALSGLHRDVLRRRGESIDRFLSIADQLIDFDPAKHNL